MHSRQWSVLGCRLVAISAIIAASVYSELVVPGLLNRAHPFSYVREADINIGLMIPIHRPGITGRCTELVQYGVVWSLLMQYAVDSINNRKDLLPNITLGFVNVDECYHPLKALEAAIYFVKDRCDMCSDQPLESHAVVGVLGPQTSSASALVAPFIGTFHLPLVSIYATANSFSDKAQYPYFMRMAPPETAQELALVKVS